MTDIGSDELLTLTADIVAAHVSHNQVSLDVLPTLIMSIHKALGQLGRPEQTAAAIQQPAVPVRSSVKRDHIVCLEDGKKLKLLKRYLHSAFGMTPAQYRAKWQLPSDYPMVAPDYAERRKALAREIGLGSRRPAVPVAQASSPPQAASLFEDVPKQPDVPVSAEAPTESAGQAIEHAVTEASVSIQKPVRKKLGLRLPETAAASSAAAGDQPDASPPPGSAASADEMLHDAIRERTCVSATYNRDHILLAPHILYTMRDEPFIRGVTLERNGKRPREVKIGTFKVAGLGDLRSTARRFVPQPGVENEPPAGTILSIVQPG